MPACLPQAPGLTTAGRMAFWSLLDTSPEAYVQKPGPSFWRFMEMGSCSPSLLCALPFSLNGLPRCSFHHQKTWIHHRSFQKTCFYGGKVKFTQCNSFSNKHGATTPSVHFQDISISPKRSLCSLSPHSPFCLHQGWQPPNHPCPLCLRGFAWPEKFREVGSGLYICVSVYRCPFVFGFCHLA